MARKGQEGVPDGYKRCSKCGEVKEAVEFISGICRPCIAEYHKEYWEKNSGKLHDKRKEYNMEYYKKNRDRCLEHSKEYYKRNTRIVKEQLPYGEKRCTKCGMIKKYDDFSISKTGKGGRNAQCKLCRKEYQKMRGIKYREKIKENKEEYEARLKYMRDWNAKNRPKKEKEVLPEGTKRCTICGCIKNIGEFRKNQGGCRDCRLEKERERRSIPENRDKKRKFAREYYIRNADSIRKWHIEYLRNNQDKIREYRQSKEFKTVRYIARVRSKTGAKIYARDLDDATFQAIHAAYMLEREIKNIEWAKKPLDKVECSSDNDNIHKEVTNG